MKTLEFKEERAAYVMSSYRQAMTQHSPGTLLIHVMEKVAKMPAPRFWVSEERASDVIAKLDRGMNPLESMIDTRRRMYLVIYARYCALRRERPNALKLDLVTEVINQPAPEHYLEPGYLMRMIQRLKRNARQKLLKLQCRSQTPPFRFSTRAYKPPCTTQASKSRYPIQTLKSLHHE